MSSLRERLRVGAKEGRDGVRMKDRLGESSGGFSGRLAGGWREVGGRLRYEEAGTRGSGGIPLKFKGRLPERPDAAQDGFRAGKFDVNGLPKRDLDMGPGSEGASPSRTTSRGS
jgi:hypothetical protein